LTISLIIPSIKQKCHIDKEKNISAISVFEFMKSEERYGKYLKIQIESTKETLLVCGFSWRFLVFNIK
jgi:hypothetical protein